MTNATALADSALFSQTRETILGPDSQIWFNGRIVSAREAVIAPDVHALHYGGSVFEGIRSYGGRVLFARQHAERLIRSAQMIGLSLAVRVDELITAFDQVLAANDLTDDAYLRPIAYRGSDGGLGLGSSQQSAQVIIFAWHWPNPFRTNHSGLNVEVSHWRRFDPQSFPTESKCSAMYVVGTMAKDQAKAQGADDALVLDYRGYVAELTGANVMFVSDGAIHTPIADCFLSGITRQAVIELARKNNVVVHERHIRVEELGNFSEALVVGTAAEITPIARIGSHHYNTGGLVTSLTNWYRQLTSGVL